MTTVIYPVAETADAALHAARGLAAREREAREVAAGAGVDFRTEPVGPAFASREAALAAYAPGAPGGAALAAGWGRLTPVTAEADSDRRPTPAARPVYVDGRRWPVAATTAPPRWRLWVSYWRIETGGERDIGAVAAPDDAARRLRRSAEGRELSGAALSALARQPLRPVKPQQPLEIGLFEARRPEAPDLIIPDE